MNPSILLPQINTYLEHIVPEWPKSLYDPVRMALTTGGKRIRPLLAALCAGDAASEDNWLPAACAVELLHTFTLVHDDIMDNAATRRGKPTIHIAFGLNEAILSGDVIVALATEALSLAPRSVEMLGEFSSGFKAVCEGQALDEEYEERDEVSLAEYFTMIELKTARLFEVAAVLGVVAGGGAHREACRVFAREIGLAFQLQDDRLDLIGNESFGKTIGGDILESKRSALFALAMQQYAEVDGKERALLDRLRGRCTEPTDVQLAREVFAKLGVMEETKRLAAEHTALAEQALLALPDARQREDLLDYARHLLGRSV